MATTGFWPVKANLLALIKYTENPEKTSAMSESEMKALHDVLDYDMNSDNIIIKNRNSIAIDCASVDCDYYDFLRHIPYAVNSYHGEYMIQYSWAEITTAVLL